MMKTESNALDHIEVSAGTSLAVTTGTSATVTPSTMKRTEPTCWFAWTGASYGPV